ncbi:MAG TPA: transcription termination factor Rho [Isosphaeraceae bacterium]|jgi:transcription termination factor Rho|nr:transcription termination factor Rho [Isosphaeraceae bacterium]
MSTVEQVCSGVLELHPKGYGFLRNPERNYKAGANDVYVGSPLLAKFRLRQGVRLTGTVEPPRRGQGPRLAELTEIEGRAPDQYIGLRMFDDLTAVDPAERIHLETGSEPLGMRVMDLLTPVGKGQRGLIVAPPRSGKTVLLQQLAAAVAKNHPELQLLVVLIDERPEEVTDMRRSVRGEVIASSNDHSTEEHIRLAQLAVDRAKRIAESGGQVLILLDSLTRVARAYNKGSNSGRTMTGGIDIKALDIPKRLFGAARSFDEGGSLTVLATCLIDTGSRMDEIIFQEFKGTGNMEVVLDRKLADRRVWPAIDIQQSGTRKEERLLDPQTLSRVTLLRRSLAELKPPEAMEALVRQLGKYPSNAEFLDKIGQFQK